MGKVNLLCQEFAVELTALFIGLLFVGGANAQACLPTTDLSSTTASPLYFAKNDKGVCVSWYCYGTKATISTYCGTWAELPKVGGRIQTIQKAKDPLKSLQDAHKRFKIVPLDDPSMDGMPK